jgi:hypothetical protein
MMSKVLDGRAILGWSRASARARSQFRAGAGWFAVLGLGTAVALMSSFGCTAEHQAAWKTSNAGKQPPDDPNIISIHKYVSQEPWLSFNPAGLREADGFKAAVYLESGTTGLGAFGDGTIRITMYVVERTDLLTEELVPMYRWELNSEQSTPWRFRNPTRLGWGYGLRLPWRDVDVSGKEIELAFQYQRRDGQMISSEPIRLRVPARSTRILAERRVENAGTTGDPPANVREEPASSAGVLQYSP